MEPPSVSRDVYILAGGGTGGHLYPGLAVAEELLRVRPGAMIVFACSDRAIDRQVLGEAPCAIVPQPIQPAPRLGSLWAFFTSYIRSARQARDMVRDLKPAAVLGTGGFAAVPLVRAGAKAGVRTGLLNPDAVPGKANRFLARRADAVFVQFAATADRFPPSLRGRVQPVGCPIRKEFFAADRPAALREMGLRDDRKTLLVAGGSLGARTVNDALAAIAADLDERGAAWQLLHVTGPGKQAGPGLGDSARRMHVMTMEYCRRMDLALAAADLVLCRAGASTVAELCATGKPAVIMPYPYHKDQHQRLNAQPLVEAGAAILVEDAKDSAANAAMLRRVLLPLLDDAARLESARRAAEGLTKPQAAADVARWMAG